MKFTRLAPLGFRRHSHGTARGEPSDRSEPNVDRGPFSPLRPSLAYPNSRRLRQTTGWFKPLQLVACGLQLLLLVITYPDTTATVIAWSALLSCYAVPALVLRAHSPPSTWSAVPAAIRSASVKAEQAALRIWSAERVELHALIGVVGITLLLAMLSRTTYGQGHPDPNSLWTLHLIPLIAVSRFGTTAAWLRVLLASVAALLSVDVARHGLELSSTAIGLPLFLSHSAPAIVVLAFAGTVLLVLTRAFREVVRQAELSRDIAGTLLRQSSFEDAYREAARALRDVHFPPVDYALILLLDEEQKELRAVACEGASEEVWRRIRLPLGEGITGRAAAERQPIVLPDTESEEGRRTFRQFEGLGHVLSALAAPIVHQDRVIGVVDVESLRRNEFDEDQDRDVVQGWADVLAISFAHFQSLDDRVAQALRVVTDTIEQGGQAADLDLWFESIAGVVGRNLGANCVALVRLAPGTGYPLLPFLLWPQRLRRPAARAGIPRRVHDDSVLWEMLRDWKIRSWDSEQDWSEWDTPADSWFYRWVRDQVKGHTFVFVPVGTVAEPLAGLFLIYPHRRSLGDAHRLALLSFAAALEKSYRSRFSQSLGRRRIAAEVHSALRTSTEPLHGLLKRLREGIEDREASLQRLALVERSVEVLESTVRQAISSDNQDLDDMRLVGALKRNGQLFKTARPSLNVSVELDVRLEDEPRDTREVLYRFASEALANAVIHGKATRIDIRGSRENTSITLEIVDHGRGLPPDPRPGSPAGILRFGRTLEQEMAATFEIGRADRPGVRVALRIPTPPADYGTVRGPSRD
jgi:signal transduction histidine kinase/putative methionine-R-sulfoxide reductase with GAF domain